MNNTDPIKKLGVNSGTREGKAVSASNKTPSVLLIYPVKSGKSLGSDLEERKHLRTLSYVIWIFRNGQPACDDDRIIFVAMTLKLRSNVSLFEYPFVDVSNQESERSF